MNKIKMTAGLIWAICCLIVMIMLYFALGGLSGGFAKLPTIIVVASITATINPILGIHIITSKVNNPFLSIITPYCLCNRFNKTIL